MKNQRNKNTQYLQLTDSRLHPSYPPQSSSHLTSPPLRGPSTLGSISPPFGYQTQTPPPRIISPSELFSLFQRVNRRYFRCSVCGHRVRADTNSCYIFLHTYVCSNAVCEAFLKDANFYHALVKILDEIEQTLKLEDKKNAKKKETKTPSFKHWR